MNASYLTEKLGGTLNVRPLLDPESHRPVLAISSRFKTNGFIVFLFSFKDLYFIIYFISDFALARGYEMAEQYWDEVKRRSLYFGGVSTNAGSLDSRSCHKCQLPGHIARNCPNPTVRRRHNTEIGRGGVSLAVDFADVALTKEGVIAAGVEAVPSSS